MADGSLASSNSIPAVNGVVQVGRLTGLDPSVLESGERYYRGHISKSGNAELRRLEAVPCVVAELDDTQAELVLLDANLNARHLGPMELARAIRRKKELLGERRGRPEKDGGNRHVFSGQTREMLAEQTGLSPRQLSEYDALNDLLPELQELVETGALGVSAGAGLARLPHEVQRAVWEALGDAVGQLKVEDVRKLRENRGSGRDHRGCPDTARSGIGAQAERGGE